MFFNDLAWALDPANRTSKVAGNSIPYDTAHRASIQQAFSQSIAALAGNTQRRAAIREHWVGYGLRLAKLKSFEFDEGGANKLISSARKRKTLILDLRQSRSRLRPARIEG